MTLNCRHAGPRSFIQARHSVPIGMPNIPALPRFCDEVFRLPLITVRLPAVSAQGCVFMRKHLIICRQNKHVRGRSASLLSYQLDISTHTHKYAHSHTRTHNTQHKRTHTRIHMRTHASIRPPSYPPLTHTHTHVHVYVNNHNCLVRLYIT